jgi:hypothetical protein
MGLNNWLERARMLCCAGGEGFCRNEDFGADTTGAGFGGVCGRIGTARPTSVWPRALSTFGLLNRLNSDILDADRSSLGTLGAGEGSRRMDEVRPTMEDARDSVSRRLVVDRPKRHREVGADSCAPLRALLVEFILS